MNFNPNGNILTINSTQVTKTAKNYHLNIVGIDFDKIPSGEGFLADKHKIVLNDEIKLGAFNVNAVLSDFGATVAAIPNEISADIDMSISSLIVKSALVKVNPRIVIEPFISNVGTLPDFVSGDDVVLDLYNPALKIDIDNRTPLTLNLNADIMSYKGRRQAFCSCRQCQWRHGSYAESFRNEPALCLQDRRRRSDRIYLCRSA